MKLKEARKIFRDKTLEDMDVDVCALVVNEEFSRNLTYFDDQRDNYRKRVVKRLISLKLPFSTDWNIGRDLREQIIEVKCPYCSHTMKSSSGGGGGGFEHDDYRCANCGAKVVISYPIPHGISVTPSPETIEVKCPYCSHTMKQLSGGSGVVHDAHKCTNCGAKLAISHPRGKERHA